jgi:CRP/FNR family cyclic AMP-dependent transcriptional regulator
MHRSGATKIVSTSTDWDNSRFNSSVYEVWGRFKDSTVSQVYPADIQLFQQDALAQDVFLIESGLVKLIRLENEGRELITNLGYPGSLIGASSVIVQESYPVTAATLTNCSLRRISADVFRSLLRTEHQFSWYLHRCHSYEILNQMIRVAQLSCHPARRRLEHLFLQLTSAMELNVSNNEIRLQVPLRHWEVAELIAVTPEHLSRLLHKMEMEGTLRREKGWLILSATHLTES